MHFDLKDNLRNVSGNQFVCMSLRFFRTEYQTKKACNAYIYIDFDIISICTNVIKQCHDATNKRGVCVLIKARGTCFVVVFSFLFVFLGGVRSRVVHGFNATKLNKMLQNINKILITFR